MTIDTSVLLAYFFVLSILGMYGWHRYFLVHEYRKNADRVPGPPPPMPDPPVVTIQLPIFNEMYVADRLIDAVCEIDYPKDLLDIQVRTTRRTRPATSSSWRCAAMRRGFDSSPAPHQPHGLQGGRARRGLKVARGGTSRF